MKCVMLSIRPKYCELIASGKKTVEVRRTKPKIDVPFKCYIYCTQNTPYNPVIQMRYEKEGGNIYTGGKRYAEFLTSRVIGEFVCDEIDNFTRAFFDEQTARDTDEIAEFLGLTCLTYRELCSYVGLKDFYGWHITDLVIYDKPKELSEFRRYVKDRCTFNEDGVCLGRNQNHVIMCDHLDCCQKEIKRPFQFWGYVEELKGETE